MNEKWLPFKNIGSTDLIFDVHVPGTHVHKWENYEVSATYGQEDCKHTMMMTQDHSHTPWIIHDNIGSLHLCQMHQQVILFKRLSHRTSCDATEMPTADWLVAC